MPCKIILKLINVLLLIQFVLPDQNVTELFNEFKLKYKRFYYGAKHEKNAFNNFVNNFNNLNDFIAKQPNQSVVYKLNKYADQDPEEVDEYYGIKIKPCELLLRIHRRYLTISKLIIFLDSINSKYSRS